MTKNNMHLNISGLTAKTLLHVQILLSVRSWIFEKAYAVEKAYEFLLKDTNSACENFAHTVTLLRFTALGFSL